MKGIYEKADQIIIWLGPATAPLRNSAGEPIFGDSSLAISIFKQISNKSIEEPDQDITDRMAATLALCHKLLASADSAGNLGAVASFLSNRYWSRVWCLQEGSTPDAPRFKCPMIWCGADRIQIRDVVLASSYLSKMRNLPGYVDMVVDFNFKRMAYVRHRRIKVKELGGVSLLDLLSKGRGMEATDAKDKVFGVWGIVYPETAGGLVVDYERTVEDVYMDLVKWHVEKTRSLDVMGLCGMRGLGLQERLPSWAPDLTVESAQPFAKEFHHITNLNEKVYDACKGKQGKVGFDGNIMVLEGIIFDKITKVSFPRSTAGGTGEEVTDAWMKFAVSDAGEEEYITGASKLEAFQHTLVADLSDKDFSSRRGERFSWGGFDETATNAFMQILAANANVEGQVPDGLWHREEIEGDEELDYEDYDEEDEEGEEDMDNELNELSDGIDEAACPSDIFRTPTQVHIITMYRRLVWTEKGYLGLAPAAANVGDIIFILFGGSVPFVLRADESSSRQQQNFRLIGECYVHGAMDGEALGDDRESIEVRIS